MHKLIILFTLFSLFVSCKKKVLESSVSEPVQIVEVVLDQDSLFCEKIKESILEESKNWSINYDGFEKQDWKIGNGAKHSDFDYGYSLVKEVHYFAKDKKNPFSTIEVDYYVLSQEKNAIELIKDYKRAYGSVDDSFVHGRVIGDLHMKVPTFLYRKGSTIFHIRTANGVAHIVSKALANFDKQENIDINDTAP